MSLSTNSALTEYEGPSRGRRQRGSVRVQEPSHGFFIAGSKLDEMNGIFGRVRNEYARFLTKHPVHLCYKHDQSGWLMALIDTPENELELEREALRYTYEEPCGMQWCFIDKTGQDRFKHKGDTIVPGAGVRWKHVHRSTKEKSKESDSETDDEEDEEVESIAAAQKSDSLADDAEKTRAARGEIVEVKEDDEDDLPWQVIALLDESILRDLRWSHAYREKRVALALKGLDVDQPLESTIEGFLESERTAMHAIEGGGFGLSSLRSTAPEALGVTSNESLTEGDESAKTQQAAGWLYRVVSAKRVNVYREPFDADQEGEPTSASELGGVASENSEGGMSSTKRKLIKQRKIGYRSEGDFVRVVEMRGCWLRLAETEKARREPPLALNDSVMVISGQYRGERGDIVRKLDPDTREFGVKLKGYTGTGSFHISELKRNGPAPGSKRAREATRAREAAEERKKRQAREEKRAAKEQQKAMMRQYYGDSYADFMSSSDEESESDEDEEVGEDHDNGNDSGSDNDDDEDYYDSSYRGPLWISTSETGSRRRKKYEQASAAKPPLLLPVSLRELGSLRTGTEKEEADLYDRPFEPRIEGGSSCEEGNGSSPQSSASMEDVKGVDSDDGHEDEDVDSDFDQLSLSTLSSPLLSTEQTASSKIASRTVESGSTSAKISIAEENDDAIPVGSSVVLRWLKTEEYNGRTGVVITKCNMDGRYGVRLDPLRSTDGDMVQAGSDKKLLLKADNLALGENMSTGTTDTTLASNSAANVDLLQQSSSAAATCLDEEEQRQVQRAARVLNVRLDAIGLGALLPAGEKLFSTQFVNQKNSHDVLNALLRAASRDNKTISSISTGSALKLQSDALIEAKKAHSVLKKAVKASSISLAATSAPPNPTACDISPPPPPSSIPGAAAAMETESGTNREVSVSFLYGCAPHTAVEKGFLGERASAAALSATDSASFNCIQSGMLALESLLADEQARLVRQRAQWTGGETLSGKVPAWRLLQAEKAAATSVFQDVDDDDCDDVEENFGGSSADDCLRIRLTIIRALMRCHRDADAAAAAAVAVGIHPNSASALLWYGRCLLRTGKRTEGLGKLSSCVALGPKSGMGGVWAHKEAAIRLRALRRALKGDIRAKDAYERGKFSEAADVYNEMLKEFEGHASDDKWGRAEALIARAACYRRDRKLELAIADCNQALAIFPRYPRALFRRAICLMEQQKPKEGQKAFEQLLRVDRKWPKLLDWLIRAAAQARRMDANGGKDAAGTSSFEEEQSETAPSGNEDFYSVLGVSTDATEAQLKRAYRLRSLKVHPDKKGGSAAAFQLVATAYETLSNPEKRQLYDDGVDVNKKKKKKKGAYDDESSESEDEDGNKKKSLREEIERKYFPENFKFWPFGDPFIEKRRHDARKKKKAEEKARKSRGGGSGRRAPAWYADY